MVNNQYFTWRTTIKFRTITAYEKVKFKKNLIIIFTEKLQIVHFRPKNDQFTLL